jgi:biofilm PGA synthesis protein PgaA
LIVGLGNYAQENFASGGVMNIQYEQLYSPGDTLELHYGIGRTVHPYDGIRDTRDFITFGADWKF